MDKRRSNTKPSPASPSKINTGPAADQPKSSVLNPVINGPSTCPKLLPCIYKPKVMGMANAMGATTGADDKTAVGSMPPVPANKTAATPTHHGFMPQLNMNQPMKDIMIKAAVNTCRREAPLLNNNPAAKLPKILAIAAQPVIIPAKK